MARVAMASFVLVLAVSFSLAAGASTQQKMSFFITSAGSGDGANLGGLAGADKHCATLAAAAGAPGGNWRAYLSAAAADGRPAVHARDRIGSGPWFNAKGVQVAANVDDLHSDKNQLSKANSITEKGEVVNGRGDNPNKHDILTGAGLDGRLPAGDADMTCKNWTSNGDGSALMGHHDRQGGGANPTSWNSAHGSKGCSQANLRATGGDGLFYCFAAGPGRSGGPGPGSR
jgi:hypothetical protein